MSYAVAVLELRLSFDLPSLSSLFVVMDHDFRPSRVLWKTVND